MAEIAPVGIDAPCDGQRAAVAGRETERFQTGADGIAAAVKNGGDKRLLFTRSDDVARGSFTKQGADGVDDDGLACARFTGQCVHAGLKRNVGAGDDGDVFDVQQIQHSNPPQNRRSGYFSKA